MIYLNRRRFLTYAGAAAAVVGGSALGLDYLNGSGSIGLGQILDRTPPIVKDFRFQPIRAVNGKNHDATISFSVEDTQSGIADVSGTLEGYAPTIPVRAYPAEPARVLQLTTSQVSPGVFSSEVNDLKGGKYYRATITAKDAAGNEASSQFETPYVREFENMSGRDSFLLGAVYLAWWENPCKPGWFCHWSEVRADYAKGTTPLGTPILGIYSSNDPLVIAKHIDWATGYGVDFFFFEFNGPESASRRFPPFLQHPLMSDIKFAFCYYTRRLAEDTGSLESIDLNDPSTYSLLESDFEYIAKNYFPHPSYLRINGHPVVQLYFTFAFKGDLSKPVAKLRDRMKELGSDIYLIGDQVSWGDEIDINRLKVFDAISNANDLVPPTSHPEWGADGRDRQEYSRWQSAARRAGIELIPFAYPGYDDSHLTDRPIGYGYVRRDAEFLSYTVKSAMQFADENRILGLVTFNDWGENTFVEPSVEDGFKYLQTLRDTLAGH